MGKNIFFRKINFLLHVMCKYAVVEFELLLSLKLGENHKKCEMFVLTEI